MSDTFTWIKCSKRLPEKDGWYLVCNINQSFYGDGYYIDKQYFSLLISANPDHKPEAFANQWTHWAPFPKLPSED